MTTDTLARTQIAQQYVIDHLAECARELLDWPTIQLPADGRVRGLSRMMAEWAGEDSLRMAVELVQNTALLAIISPGALATPAPMSDSAPVESVLDSRNHMLTAEFRQKLEEVVTNASMHYYGEYPDSLRSLLLDGMAGIRLMSDTALLDYAVNTIDLGDVDGHALIELASRLASIDTLHGLSYRVKWEIDVDAPSPELAACRARDHMRATARSANAFEVRNKVIPEEVAILSLEQLDEEREAQMRRVAEAAAEAPM